MTRNVQEGLPFTLLLLLILLAAAATAIANPLTISDVKRQTNNERLLAAVCRHLLFSRIFTNWLLIFVDYCVCLQEMPLISLQHIAQYKFVMTGG